MNPTFLWKKEDRNKMIYAVIYITMVELGLGDLLYTYGPKFVEQNIMFVVYGLLVISVLVLFHKELWNGIRGIKMKELDSVCLIAIITILCQVASSIFLAIILKIQNVHQETIDSQAGTQNTILFKLAVVVLAPIAEEFFFRYSIVKLSSKHKKVLCVLSVFLFAFAHVWIDVIYRHDWMQLIVMLPYAVLGTGLVFTYNKTKNICYPIIIHMAVNMLGSLS